MASATWQLVINTGTTIITFPMVFLVQAAQNRQVGRAHRRHHERRHQITGIEKAPGEEIESAKAAVLEQAD
ncbi:low affinity iron permease family protein [Bradyrhizobium sp. CCGB12]|uniref:low affinity iron permease family protein n=1 Tax=Bradyrhizobium sp. CCGB12 TaxID=2949632 RepID=UPI0035C0409E